jgi:integrase
VASIQKRPNGKWRARYRDDAGRERARHFERKADAQRWLDEQTAALVTGQWVDPRKGRTTLRQYAAGWESTNVAGETATRITDNALRLHILPVLGDRPMASLRRSDVQGLVKGLAERLAPGTVRNVYEVLARCMAAAVEDKVIALSPCRKIALPARPEAEVVPPTVEQVQALADTIPGRYRAAVVMLAGSGLRIGELLALRPGDVHFLRRTARVERQRVQDGRITPPKTPKSVRTVPLGQVVLEELAAHMAAYPPVDGYLFADELGRPLTYRQWKRAWAAGVPGELTTHDLRHFFASALIAGGASVKQVQTVLGHSSAVITLRVYAHLWPGDDDRTRSIIDATLGGLRTGCGPVDLDAGSTAGQSG